MIRRLPGASLPRADVRRQFALDMFDKSHIAPSYRRLPHPSWTTCFKLLLDLLLGAGKTRYIGTRPHARHHREIFVRGFSAGAYGETWDHMRNAVIDEVTVRGKAHQPSVVVNLIRSFLMRLPLPRLLHFLTWFSHKWCRYVLQHNLMDPNSQAVSLLEISGWNATKVPLFRSQ